MITEKRKIYDQYGEEGLKGGFGGGRDGADMGGAEMGGGHRFSARDPNDIFKQFFSSCMLPSPHISSESISHAFFTVGADHDDDFSGIRSFSFSSSGHGGVPQQQQGLGGMHGGFFPSFGGFGGTHGMSGMNGFGSGGVAGFGRKEPPVVRDISLTLVCTLL